MEFKLIFSTILSIVIVLLITRGECVKFTILQYGDINAQAAPFTDGIVPPVDNYDQNSVGGFMRLYSALESEASSSESDSVFQIQTGNFLGGSNGWLSVVGISNYGEALGIFKPHFMGLGLKEFESGLTQANIFINSSTYISETESRNKPLVTNLNKETSYEGEEKKFSENVLSFKTEFVGNTTIKIGFVGFVNPLSMSLSDPGGLDFIDPSTAIKNTISKESELRAVNCIIAIGGGSYEIAKKILEENPKVKLVLYSGGTATRDYPFELSNGKFIGGTNELSYGAKIGKIEFDLSENGELTKLKSALIKTSVTKNPPTELTVWFNEANNKINAAKANYVGRSLVNLSGKKSDCWRSECNLGNLVSDSMVHCALVKLLNSNNGLPPGLNWEQLGNLVSFWHSGALHDDLVEHGTNITEMDIHRWLPYHNNVYLVILSGKDLKDVFKTSGKAIIAQNNTEIKDWGQFLQVSDGIEVNYGKNGELESLKMLHSEYQIPYLSEIEDEKVYPVVIPSIIFRGRSVYSFIKDKFKPIASDSEKYKYIDFDDNCVENYIRSIGFLKTGFSERIFIGGESGGGGNGTTPCTPNANCPKCNKNTATTVVLTIVFFILIVGLVFVGINYVWPYIQSRRRMSSYP